MRAARCSWSAGPPVRAPTSTPCRAPRGSPSTAPSPRGEDLDEELARLTDAIEAAAARAGGDVRIEVLQRQPAAATDADHPAADALRRAVATVEGAPRFERCPGVLETRWYAQLGIPAFAYGPGRLEVSHGPEEELDEAAMRRCAAVYALALARVGP